MFVLYDNEKTRIVAEKFNASAQGGLRINGKFVRIIKDNAFEQGFVVALDIGLGKVFEFVANKFDALSVGAVYKHDVGFDAIAVAVVNAVDKIADNGSLATPRRTVEDNVGDFADLDKIVEFSSYKIVFVKNGCHLQSFRFCFYLLFLYVFLFMYLLLFLCVFLFFLFPPPKYFSRLLSAPDSVSSSYFSAGPYWCDSMSAFLIDSIAAVRGFNALSYLIQFFKNLEKK